MWPKTISTLLLFTFFLAGCAAPTPSPTPTRPLISGKLTFAGSTTVQPLADRLGQQFQAQNPQVSLEIAAGGSAVGIKAIHEGAVDIGMASRALKPEEQEGIQSYVIALDVLAIIVNPANPVNNLSHTELKKIYLGEIQNWKEVGGKDEAIVPVTRDKNSGSRSAFDEIALEKKDAAAAKLKTVITAGDMAAEIAKNPSAIGYVGFGNLDKTVKVLAIDGISPTQQTIRNGNYKLFRPLLLMTGPLSQPLADYFIQYALSGEGQKTVEAQGWIPATP